MWTYCSAMLRKGVWLVCLVTSGYVAVAHSEARFPLKVVLAFDLETVIHAAAAEAKSTWSKYSRIAIVIKSRWR